MSRIEGTVLVTGGTGALGRAVCAELLDAGARVVTTCVVRSERETCEELFGDRELFEVVEADLSGDEGATAAVGSATRSHPPLTALVNVVGGFAMGGRVHEAPDGELDSMLQINLGTAYRTTRAALPTMIEQGGGSIVCIGAKAAREPASGGSAYAISKAAALALVRSLALEYRDEQIRANAVLPSIMDTPANREAMPDADHASWVEPVEIARVIRFLCSPESRVTSGAEIPVYGQAG